MSAQRQQDPEVRRLAQRGVRSEAVQRIEERTLFDPAETAHQHAPGTVRFRVARSGAGKGIEHQRHHLVVDKAVLFEGECAGGECGQVGGARLRPLCAAAAPLGLDGGARDDDTQADECSRERSHD